MSDAMALPYCKLCEIEDFASPELLPVLRRVFGHLAADSPDFLTGAEHRKHWEVAMAVRALEDLGAVRPDATILGVGAGTEVTSFYLATRVGSVVATDLYLA